MENRRFENNSSPPATVEEIQRRLVRPPSLQFHSSTIPSLDDRHPKTGYSSNATDFQIRNKEQLVLTNKKLDDYLDPALLSTVCAKIGGKKRKQDHEYGDIIKREEFHDDFEWPHDELKVFKEVSNRTENIDGSGKRRHRRSNCEAVVDLHNDDLDPIKDQEDEGHEDQLYCTRCTPFRKFEIMASKQFKGPKVKRELGVG